MEAFIASLQASYVHDHLLQAHAHRAASAAPEWERLQLQLALDHFDALVAAMAPVRERLAHLNAPKSEKAAA